MCDHFGQSERTTEILVWAAEVLNGIDIAQVDPETLHGARLTEALVALDQASAKLEAAKLRVLPVWNDRQAWKADGARTGGAWLARNTGMAASTARERLRVAEALRAMPHTSDAVASGRLGYTHARSSPRRPRTPTPPRPSWRMRRSWSTRRRRPGRRGQERHRPAAEPGAPTRAEEIEARRHRMRSARRYEDLDGLKRWSLALPTETDLLLHPVLHRLTELDWAARQRKSDAGASLPDGDRTHTQKLADAFHQLLERASATIGAEAGTYRLPEPRMVVGWTTTPSSTASATPPTWQQGSRSPAMPPAGWPATPGSAG